VYGDHVSATSHRGRLIGLLTVAAILPLLLGACSSSSTAGGTTTTRAGGDQAPTSACALVPAAQVKSILSMQVGAPGIVNSSVATTCNYPAKDNAGTADDVIISFRGGVTSAIAATELAGVRSTQGTTTDVSGASFTAYYYHVVTGGLAFTSLVTLERGVQVTVVSTASLDKIESLTEQIYQSFASKATSTTAQGPTTTTP